MTLIHRPLQTCFIKQHSSALAPWAMDIHAMAEAPATTCLLLVCGLPGSGKSSFCQLVTGEGSQGTQGTQGTSWIHFCYDGVERALRADRSSFDPEAWQEARAKIRADVGSLLDDNESESNRVIVLDDNMYYRSMRCLTEVGKLASN